MCATRHAPPIAPAQLRAIRIVYSPVPPTPSLWPPSPTAVSAAAPAVPSGAGSNPGGPHFDHQRTSSLSRQWQRLPSGVQSKRTTCHVISDVSRDFTLSGERRHRCRFVPSRPCRDRMSTLLSSFLRAPWWQRLMLPPSNATAFPALTGAIQAKTRSFSHGWMGRFIGLHRISSNC